MIPCADRPLIVNVRFVSQCKGISGCVVVGSEKVPLLKI